MAELRGDNVGKKHSHCILSSKSGETKPEMIDAALPYFSGSPNAEASGHLTLRTG